MPTVPLWAGPIVTDTPLCLYPWSLETVIVRHVLITLLSFTL